MSSFEARLIPAALGSNLDLIDWGSWLNEATVAHDCPLYLILSTLHALLCAPIASFNRLQLAFALLALSTAAELDAFEAARSYDRLSYANGAKKVASALTTTNIFVLENGSTLLRESKWYACTVRRHGKEFDKAILLDGRWFGDLLSASHPPSPSKLVWSLTTICHELGHVVATDLFRREGTRHRGTPKAAGIGLAHQTEYSSLDTHSGAFLVAYAFGFLAHVTEEGVVSFRSAVLVDINNWPNADFRSALGTTKDRLLLQDEEAAALLTGAPYWGNLFASSFCPEAVPPPLLPLLPARSSIRSPSQWPRPQIIPDRSHDERSTGPTPKTLRTAVKKGKMEKGTSSSAAAQLMVTPVREDAEPYNPLARMTEKYGESICKPGRLYVDFLVDVRASVAAEATTSPPLTPSTSRTSGKGRKGSMHASSEPGAVKDSTTSPISSSSSRPPSSPLDQASAQARCRQTRPYFPRDPFVEPWLDVDSDEYSDAELDADGEEPDLEPVAPSEVAKAEDSASDEESAPVARMVLANSEEEGRSARRYWERWSVHRDASAADDEGEVGMSGRTIEGANGQ